MKAPVAPFITETALIALSTLIAYLSTLLYNQGAADFYKIPLSLTSLSLTSVIQLSTLVIVVFLVLFGVFNIFYELIASVPAMIMTSCLKPIVVFLLLCFGLSFIFGGQFGKICLASAVVTSPFLAIDLLDFAVSTRKVKGLKNKICLYDKVRDSTLIGHVTRRIGLAGVGLLIIAVVTLNVSYYLGYENAKKRIEYTLLHEKSDTAVAFAFDDRLICIKYNPRTRKILPGYTVISFGANPAVSMERSPIGPLTREEQVATRQRP